MRWRLLHYLLDLFKLPCVLWKLTSHRQHILPDRYLILSHTYTVGTHYGSFMSYICWWSVDFQVISLSCLSVWSAFLPLSRLLFSLIIWEETLSIHGQLSFMQGRGPRRRACLISLPWHPGIPFHKFSFRHWMEMRSEDPNMGELWAGVVPWKEVSVCYGSLEVWKLSVERPTLHEQTKSFSSPEPLLTPDLPFQFVFCFLLTSTPFKEKEGIILVEKWIARWKAFKTTCISTSSQTQMHDSLPVFIHSSLTYFCVPFSETLLFFLVYFCAFSFCSLPNIVAERMNKQTAHCFYEENVYPSSQLTCAFVVREWPVLGISFCFSCVFIQSISFPAKAPVSHTSKICFNNLLDTKESRGSTPRKRKRTLEET